MYDYKDEESAARGLLIEVSSNLLDREVDFAIVGGWIPYLFNSQPYTHPGTFDVDILLNEETPRKVFESAADNLVELGFMRAPKNQFQLHKVITVRGEQMVYHLDFLHRRYADDTDDMIRQWGRFQSIAGPGTDLIFTENEKVFRAVEGIISSGEQLEIEIPFATEVGFLSAKGRSAQVPKRTRDAYDIFLVVSQSIDYDLLVKRSSELLANGIFRWSIAELVHGFLKGKLTERAAAHLSEQNPEVEKTTDIVRRTMTEFFKEIGLLISNVQGQPNKRFKSDAARVRWKACGQ